MIQAACLSQACVCWHRRLSVSGTVDVLCSQRNAQESPDPSADKSLQDLHLKLANVQVRLILHTAVCLPCLHGSGADNHAACATMCRKRTSSCVSKLQRGRQ